MSRKVSFPALCKQSLLSIVEIFFSGSFRPLAVEQLRDLLLRRSDPIPFPAPANPHLFFFFLYQQDWCKETKSEDKKWFCACCWNYIGRFFKEKTFNCISKLFSAAGKSHLGVFLRAIDALKGEKWMELCLYSCGWIVAYNRFHFLSFLVSVWIFT